MPDPMAPYGQGSSERMPHTQSPAVYPPWIVLVPFPAFGHVNPMRDLSHAILRHAGGSYRPLIANPAFIHRRMFPTPQPPLAAAVDAATETSSPAENTDGLLQEEQNGVVFASLPDGIEDNPDFFEIDAAMETRMPSQLDALLCRLGRVACVVVDLLASWAIQVAERHEIPVAGFWPAMFATYKIISAAPLMIQKGLISESGLPKDTEVSLSEILDDEPMATFLTLIDLPWLVGDEASQQGRFRFWQRILSRTSSISPVIINSFSNETKIDVESKQKELKYQSLRSSHHHVMHLAAILQKDHSSTSTTSMNNHKNDGKVTHNQLGCLYYDHENCIEWLARWAPSSVVYVSFSTWAGNIREDKVKEIMLGLEATCMPFLIVLKDTWRNGIPTGFLDRVGERGKVVGWAPQRQVLRHKAVGCFITHCGWNSTMEAIRFAKCLVCYPIFADQFINSEHIVSIWKVGVRLRDMERGCVADSIRKVMNDLECGSKDGCEGSSMISRMLHLRERMLGEEVYSKAKFKLESFFESLKC